MLAIVPYPLLSQWFSTALAVVGSRTTGITANAAPGQRADPGARNNRELRFQEQKTALRAGRRG